MQDPVYVVRRRIWRETGLQEGDRPIPEETAVSLTFNGGSYAVMMATHAAHNAASLRIDPPNTPARA